MATRSPTSNEYTAGTNTAENLRGFEGNDLLEGGLGEDTYYYRWGDNNIVLRNCWIPIWRIRHK